MKVNVNVSHIRVSLIGINEDEDLLLVHFLHDIWFNGAQSSAKEGATEKVQLLLDAGADPNLRFSGRGSAIEYANYLKRWEPPESFAHSFWRDIIERFRSSTNAKDAA